ncbi:DUF262 domain-containing protein [Adonisia turfae]|uniref:DUF262 domain-containing protein n=1 Tax=Adonisia turfae CCMR0081 TaxID=2292702 RepID=A0A6M0RD45_9CYAN|nr:DUF262 domain-containing HNH endonuclease family protein [Adonisia turfae]NEZ54156.1 DUF262 domain-containing protein [Adonisia turfae CCMR0081]
MQASETKLQPIIEGTKQYVVPLFQRSYSWGKDEWGMLWNDLVDLASSSNARTHFIGSIVTMPTVSVPEGVTKYMLIDGQQRLTTIFIILAYLRDFAKEDNKNELSEEIDKTLLVNPYKKGNDFYKIFPTQDDRESFKCLIKTNLENSPENKSCDGILKAYNFFKRKINQSKIDIETLKKVITNNLSVVSIVLNAEDNPYLVFESLNAKGRPLTQADLIKNFFFMRIHVNEQDTIYSDYWKPMQNSLDNTLTEYIRHYLMKDGSKIKENDIYFFLKEKVDKSKGDVVLYLKDLYKFSKYYSRILEPRNEINELIREALSRINRIGVTTAYPFLLNCYDLYIQNILSSEEFLEILKVIENFIIRRFVCSIPTNRLNQIFASLYSQVQSKYPDNLVEGIKNILETKGYPKNPEFKARFKDIRFLGSKDRVSKTKLILEAIEKSHGHKESINFNDLEVERIMPDSLTDDWKHQLGREWEPVHELYKDVIGNLTLTGYTSEISNESFNVRKKLLDQSHLEINKHFRDKETWTKDDIEWRSEFLANMALSIWGYFGSTQSIEDSDTDITGTNPSSMMILGKVFAVRSWRDVLVNTLDAIAELDPENFEQAITEFPKSISTDKSKFHAGRKLKSGYFVEANLSAKAIKKFCHQFLEECKIDIDEWNVMYS